MLVTDLGGHSGCKVCLCEDGEKVFVKKISSSIDYNNRLQEQCNKQNRFVQNGGKSAEILNSGTTEEGLFYFDMNYVKGKTLAESIKTVETYKINELVDNLLSNIQITKNSKTNVDKVLISNKITTLENQLSEMMGNETLVNALHLLKKYNWDAFIQTECHGDLTLENIIIKNDKLIFIDFLDSFYNSFYIDLGTLYQDLLCLWSFRNEELSSSSLVRIITFKNLLTDKLIENYKINMLDVYYSLLFKLLRIYPYAKEYKTVDFLNEKVLLVIKKINDEVCK